MSKINEDHAVKFLNGILTQPGLSEEFTQGFATRSIKDKNLVNNIIRSQRIDSVSLTSKPSKISRKDSTSKVDRIIADFLSKVKERGIHTEKSAHIAKENIPIPYQSQFSINKRTNIDDGPLKYFANTSNNSNENTRTNIFIPDIDDNGYVHKSSSFKFNENFQTGSSRLPRFGNSSPFIDIERKRPNHSQISNECDRYIDYNSSSPKHLKRNQHINNNTIIKNIPQISSQNFEKKVFNFPCDGISPIEYYKPGRMKSLDEYHRTIYNPNACSTPLNHDFELPRKGLFEFGMTGSSRSVATQTLCNHRCLACSPQSNKKMYKDNFNYLFEE